MYINKYIVCVMCICVCIHLLYYYYCNYNWILVKCGVETSSNDEEDSEVSSSGEDDADNSLKKLNYCADDQVNDTYGCNYYT